MPERREGVADRRLGVGDRRVGERDRRVGDRRVGERDRRLRDPERPVGQDATPRRLTVFRTYVAVLTALIAGGVIVLMVIAMSFVQVYKGYQKQQRDQHAAFCRLVPTDESCPQSR